MHFHLLRQIGFASWPVTARQLLLLRSVTTHALLFCSLFCGGSLRSCLSTGSIRPGIGLQIGADLQPGLALEGLACFLYKHKQAVIA